MLLVALQGGTTAAAQTAAQTAPPPLVSHIRFEGVTSFSESTLLLRVRTRANRRFLGVPGFTWWRWLYDTGASGRLGRRVGKVLMATGEPPAWLDSTLLAADIERLRLFYQQEGFRAAQVTAAVLPGRRPQHHEVVFRIAEGQPTYVRHVRYQGLEALDPPQQMQLARASVLRPAALDPAQPLQFQARQQRYSEPVLLEEGRRLLAFLRNQGYALATRDSIHALVFPQQPDSFDVTFLVQPGPRYRFGDVVMQVSGPQDELPVRADTLPTPPVADSLAGGEIRIVWQGEGRLERGLLRRALQFRPGEWYSQNRLTATKRRLEATGVFAFTDLVAVPPDPLREAANTAPRLDHRMLLQTRQRHQVRMETFMLQRSGALADTDNELGAGLGLSYQNRNLFGSGEAFRLRTTGSVAADIEQGISTSAQWEVSASMTYPYLIRPFGGLDRRLRLYDARTQVAFTLLAARRDALRIVLRGRGSARVRLELQHTPTLTSALDLLDLTVSNPDTLAGFRREFLDDVLGTVDDPVQRAQLIEDYTRPQVNNALRYTLRSARLDPLRREEGYSYEAAFEVGGFLPRSLDRFVFTPDSLEGSLPGLPFFTGERAGDNRLLYRQYVRLIGDLRRYQPLARRTVLASKLIVGVAQPVAASTVVPFDERFFSGGAASVRGWRLRELGPGPVSFLSEADTTNAEITNILGGDVKLEGSLELRNTVLRGFLEADWIVALFADAGNVWIGPRNPGDPAGRFRLDRFYRELGVGSGLGLRLSWAYFIARLDVAWKVHDPAQPYDLLPEGLRNPLLHFGIGHSF
jgi:outer membrane protein assembly factor BamA